MVNNKSYISRDDFLRIKGSTLRAMRRAANLRTVDMASIAGVKVRKTYENWEKDVGAPNVNQFFEMAKVCSQQTDLERVLYFIRAL